MSVLTEIASNSNSGLKTYYQGFECIQYSVANLKKNFLMSKFKHFLGIDVSKEYFDAAVIEGGKRLLFIINFPTILKALKNFVNG